MILSMENNLAKTFAIVLATGLISMRSMAPAMGQQALRLNQIQVVGTHNSYHIAPAPSVMQLIGAKDKEQVSALDYTHPPLSEQLGREAVRQIELDIYADPVGGLFAHPAARKMLQDQGKDPGPDPNAHGELLRPGFKVLHMKDVDFISVAPTFVAALRQVKSWSKAHPTHVPIMIQVELKEDGLPGLSDNIVKFDRKLLDAMDAEILSVFSRKQIITPDDVRGKYASLPEAIHSQGWPVLDKVRGKVMFTLDNEGALTDLYLQNHAALKGRLLFVSVSDESNPAAAWFKINDPITDFDRIQRLVKAGFMVRTRADEPTVQARANDVTMRDRAFASGAQFVSTDFPTPRPDYSSYRVRLPNGIPAHPNPVSAKDLPADLDVEKRR